VEPSEIRRLLEQMSGHIETLVDQVAEVRRSNRTLEKSIATLGERMDRLESKVDRLESKIDQLESKVSQLESRIDNLESSVGEVRSRLDELGPQVEQRFQHLLEVLSEEDRRLKVRIEQETVERAGETFSLSKRLETVEARLDRPAKGRPSDES